MCAFAPQLSLHAFTPRRCWPRFLPDTVAEYAYVWNVNRIFGEDNPIPDRSEFRMDSHLVNAQYTGFTYGKFEPYAYLFDFSSVVSERFSTQTYGLRFDGVYPVTPTAKVLYTGEYARQSDYSENPNGIGVNYWLGELGGAYTFGGQVESLTAKVSYEVLGGDGGVKSFQTPLGTHHAFQGWADRFLITPGDGIEDIFVTLKANVRGAILTAVYHDPSSDQDHYDYGTEWDLLVEKTFFKHYTIGLKYSDYEADDNSFNRARNSITGQTFDLTKFWALGTGRVLRKYMRHWHAPGLADSGPLFKTVERLREFGQGLEQVADQPVVGDLEDRRLRVLVEGDDDLAVLHPGQVLYRAGDPDGDIEIGRDDLAGLPNLVVVGNITRINGRARGADGGPQLVGEFLDQSEIFRAAEAPPAGDDDPGGRQFRPFAFGELMSHEGGDPERIRCRDGLNRGVAALDRRRLESGCAHGDDLDRIDALHGGHGVAGIDRPDEGIGSNDPGNIGDLRDVEQRRDARQHVLAEGGRRCQYVTRTSRGLDDQGSEFLGERMRVMIRVCVKHLAHAFDRGSRRGNLFAIFPCDEHGDLAAQLQRGRHDRQRGCHEARVVVFRDDQNAHFRSPSLRCAAC